MIIKCKKCVLRKWKISDIPNLVNYANNPKIASNMRDRFPNPYTLKKGKEWLKTVYNDKCAHNFAITLNDKAVGSIGLVIGKDIEKISAETGYWLGEEYWGQGIVS